MKYTIIDTFPNSFFENKNGPLVSIYQKTSRTSPDNKKDALVFKNLVKTVENSLREKYNTREIKPLLDMFDLLIKDNLFWRFTLDGIAVFATLDECVIYNLERDVKTIAIVANTFHIKPLIEYYQIVKPYQILDLDSESFRIYEATPYHVSEVILGEDVPTTRDEILGTERQPNYLTTGKYRGVGVMTYHGHGGKKPIIDIDIENFFRRVDAYVNEHISKVSRLPLILLAPAEYHTLFIEMSNNIYLETRAISGTFELLGKDYIMAEVTAYSSEVFNSRVDHLLNEYHELYDEYKSSEQIHDIVTAALEGRVENLFIEEDKIIPGKIEVKKEKVKIAKLDDPQIDDVLDDIAQLTLAKGGNVFILSKEKMPAETGIAAIYRY